MISNPKDSDYDYQLDTKVELLIVDDRPENLLALEAILEHPSLDIVRATSGNEALSLMLKHDFALVLLDVQMPGMDGFETAQLMRGYEKTRHIPIIFVTAINKEQKFVFRGYEAGAVDYLFKPLDPNILKGKVNVFLDLYRQREAKKHLMAELERSNRELQDFAHMTSHDLKAPLRSMRFSVQMLEEDYAERLDGDAREYLQTITTACRRMQVLIDDLLDYARVTTQPRDFDTIDLTDLIEDIRLDLRGQLQDSGATLHLDDLPDVRGDKMQIQRLFQNLISNAIKYRRQDVSPEIRIRADRMDSQNLCHLHVEDNGIGFDAKHAERIFQPFQRLHSHKKYEGSGIGLAICKKIAQHHGGDIAASSVEGQGSQFTVILPMTRAT
ncbi:Response regulator [Sulfidibacter corallicola]|uniref:histidine kinase n=1 Tax=Sulfidibacter corallicola TaxID=2818388 RepID=A0A8A4TKV6_SULCO|nr:ATP-binding protein [Sulfidibacter corallicola]QTD49478.1 response regulator [Sulfidibacter corallicola]